MVKPLDWKYEVLLKFFKGLHEALMDKDTIFKNKKLVDEVAKRFGKEFDDLIKKTMKEFNIDDDLMPAFCQTIYLTSVFCLSSLIIRKVFSVDEIIELTKFYPQVIGKTVGMDIKLELFPDFSPKDDKRDVV